MTWMTSPSRLRSLHIHTLGLFVLATASVAPFVACGDGAGTADDRFAARTYDEYTAPLSNVVVGTPEGVVRGATRMPDGRLVGGDAPHPEPVEVESLPVGPAGDGGVGGSSGSSSSSGGPPLDAWTCATSRRDRPARAASSSA